VVSLRTVLVIVVACGVGNAISTSAQTVVTGRISGRVVDIAGGPLPGVRVTVTGPGLHEETVTDGSGHFAVEGLLQASSAAYGFTAELAGFETVNVVSSVSQNGVGTTVTIRMRVGCIEPDLEVIPELHETVQDADVVALIRLDSVQRQSQVRLGDYCGPVTTFATTIIDAVKDRRAQRLGSIQFAMLDHRGVFEPGNDYIAFVKWHPGTRAYRVMSRSYLVPVQAGWVKWPYEDIYGVVQSGPIIEVINALRSIATQP
jgi:hypothetical protein